jgi:enoyl-CoA hydratase/carnithine racemase
MISIEVADGVKRLVLDRPHKRNALNWEMVSALTRGIADAEADPDCRCVVIKGRGDAFCSGRDLGAGKGRDSELEAILADDDAYQALFEALRRLSKPSVAVVRGAAVAGGFTLAMGCDFVLATRDARFGALEMRGGFPAAVNTAILSHLVGPRLALELLLSRETASAARLSEMGLVNRLAADADDLARIEEEFVAGLVALEPVAVRLTKETHRAVTTMPLGEALTVAKQLNALLMASGRIDKAAAFFATAKAERKQGTSET